MRLSIRVKLISGATLILIAMAIVGWRGIVGMRDINKDLNAINSDQFEPARLIANANIGLIAWNRATLNHVLAENIPKMDEYERIMLEQKATVLERLQTLSGMDQLSARGKGLLRKLIDNFSKADPIRDHVVLLSRAGKQEEGRKLIRAELRPIIDEVDADMTEFLQLQERQLHDTLKATDERYVWGLTRISLIIGIAIVASFLIFFFLSTSVMNGIKELIKGAQLAAEGDLAQAKVSITSKDEFDYLGAVFNEMLDRLEENLKERKRAEEALQESNERLSAFMESAPDSFVIYDSELNLVEINKVGLEVFPTGTKKEDIIGKNMTELAPGIEETDRYDGYLEVLETGESFFADDFIPHPKFGDIYLTVKAFKIGKNLGIIVTDITKRKQTEEVLEKSYKDLKAAQEQLVRHEKLAVLGQLAGGVGHELRNPLGVMSNAVYYLNTILPDADETTKEYMEIISSEISNADKIVSDLLDFSRVTASEREKIALAELVAKILEKQRAPEDVEVTITMPPELPAVFVDPDKIGQVLGNLITNAFQAMPDGGRLTVRARDEGDKVSLSITDTGCGISKENMKNIFEPLFTTRARGIGLGLAVSRSLVEANGGSINVESEEGKGTTFTLILPTKEVM